MTQPNLAHPWRLRPLSASSSDRQAQPTPILGDLGPAHCQNRGGCGPSNPMSPPTVPLQVSCTLVWTQALLC